MEVLKGLQFLKKRFTGIWCHRVKWSRKLLLGSVAVVLLMISGIAIWQISDKTVSGQKVSVDDLEENEGNGNAVIETEADYYKMFISLTTEEVEQFAEAIKKDILTNDWEALAEKISYPIVISGTTVHNCEEFLKLDIERNLNQGFVEAIRAETCRKMFCNWQGVMMGETGQIWFTNVDNGKGTLELLIIGMNELLEE